MSKKVVEYTSTEVSSFAENVRKVIDHKTEVADLTDLARLEERFSQQISILKRQNDKLMEAYVNAERRNEKFLEGLESKLKHYIEEIDRINQKRAE